MDSLWFFFWGGVQCRRRAPKDPCALQHDKPDTPIVLFMHGVMCDAGDIPGTSFIHLATREFGFRCVLHKRGIPKVGFLANGDTDMISANYDLMLLFFFFGHLMSATDVICCPFVSP
jgi:hypothetical protein